MTTTTVDPSHGTLEELTACVAEGEQASASRWPSRVPSRRSSSAALDGHGECFVETGGRRAGFGSGDFYAEPLPRITLRHPAWRWHLGKVLLEKTWLWRWF